MCVCMCSLVREKEKGQVSESKYMICIRVCFLETMCVCMCEEKMEKEEEE